MFLFQGGGFHKVGKLMATSVVQGGSGSPFLYKGLYSYITGKEPSDLEPDHRIIPDPEVEDFVDKV